MLASIVKYFYGEGYSIRQTAIISEVSEDYVRKIIAGKRAKEIPASKEGVTDGMLRRKRTIDYIMTLRGYQFIEGTNKYSYISLLSYMGFTIDEIQLLFPLDKRSFIGVAVFRSGSAWKNFESARIGLDQRDYDFTFIQHEKTYEKAVTETVIGASNAEEAHRESRRQAKLEGMKKRANR